MARNIVLVSGSSCGKTERLITGVAAFIADKAQQTTSIASSERPVWRDPDCGQPVVLTNPSKPFGGQMPPRIKRRLMRRAKRKAMRGNRP